ncbi:MAG: metallophosphoesterase [Anaeromyxobacteraceae bacterium]
MERTLAHVSDLHVGRDEKTDARTRALGRTLAEAGVDDVLVTGDVTHRGRHREYLAFLDAFEPVADRMIVVPGNHDRLGEDAGERVMRGARVDVVARPGLHVVRLDSTAPHNRDLVSAHGQLGWEDIEAVEGAVAAAPRGALVALALHHHLVRLPADHLGERLVTWLGWPHASELGLGRELAAALRGRCDLVAHGHRHAEASFTLPSLAGRPLRILNAGSTPELGRARLVGHAGGRIVSERWLELSIAAPVAA